MRFDVSKESRTTIPDFDFKQKPTLHIETEIHSKLLLGTNFSFQRRHTRFFFGARSAIVGHNPFYIESSPDDKKQPRAGWCLGADTFLKLRECYISHPCTYTLLSSLRPHGFFLLFKTVLGIFLREFRTWSRREGFEGNLKKSDNLYENSTISQPQTLARHAH